MPIRAASWTLAVLAAWSASAWSQAGAATAAEAVVYRCPGPPVLYTDALTPREARDKGCRTIEGAPITIVQTPKPRAVPAPAAGGAGKADNRVDPASQRSRDADARRILTEELEREQQRLGELQREYNHGEPERRGDERNYQKYLDRVSELKAGIMRKEADIAALKRELSKLAP